MNCVCNHGNWWIAGKLNKSLSLAFSIIIILYIFKKTCAGFDQLTGYNKENNVKMFQKFLKHYESKGYLFLTWIINADDMDPSFSIKENVCVKTCFISQTTKLQYSVCGKLMMRIF